VKRTAVRMLAERTGLRGALSSALACGSFTPVHDRGQVLVDTAVMLADGVRRSPISTCCGIKPRRWVRWRRRRSRPWGGVKGVGRRFP